MFEGIINETKNEPLLFSRTVKRVNDVLMKAHRNYFDDTLSKDESLFSS